MAQGAEYINGGTGAARIAITPTAALSVGFSDAYNHTENSSYQEPASRLWQVVHGNNIHLYCLPFIFFIGVIGNMLSLCVLLRPRMRCKSTFLYLAGVACADIVYLLVNCLQPWILYVTGDSAVHRNTWLCKTKGFLGGVSSHYSVWVIILVTVERFIVIINPLKAPVLSQRSRAIPAMAILMGVIIAINAHELWMYGLVTYPEYGNATYCQELPQFEYFMHTTWYWIDSCIYSLIPFAIIITLNTLIIVRTRRARRIRRQISSCHNGSPDSNKRLTAMLLTLSFTFLLLTTPMSAYLIYEAARMAAGLPSDDPADAWFIDTILWCLMLVNHAINFFLYCLVGKKFRQELVLFLRCRSGSAEPRRGSLSTNLTTSVRGDAHIRLHSME